jgi:hypothetical protein
MLPALGVFGSMIQVVQRCYLGSTMVFLMKLLFRLH